jgi:hypothetical protein
MGQTLAGTQTILNKFICGFPQPFEANAKIIAN